MSFARARSLCSGITCTLLACALVAGESRSDSAPARELATPEARKLRDSDASEYWDLTVELSNRYRVMARFQITNQGPGELNGTAVGHVIAPDGSVTQFRNGRLENRWTLSDDGRDLDIGKSHLEMRLPRYKLKVNKPDARIRISFPPNALHRLPKKLVGKDYRVDLLALGAPADGSIQLEHMAEKIRVEGRASLTHTIAKRSETDVALRRIEVFQQQGERPLYLVQFLGPKGKPSSWLASLEPGCDPAFSPKPFPAGEVNPAPPVQKTGPISDEACLRRLITKTGFDLALDDPKQSSSKRGKNNSYWIPPAISLANSGRSTGDKTHILGQVLLGERFLQHEPLDDLPGPIRFLAGLSTKPRRVWSEAGFEVTIRPTLDSKPISIQGQGVATVSFINPVSRP